MLIKIDPIQKLIREPICKNPAKMKRSRVFPSFSWELEFLGKCTGFGRYRDAGYTRGFAKECFRLREVKRADKN